MKNQTNKEDLGVDAPLNGLNGVRGGQKMPEKSLAVFEGKQIRRHYDENMETWYFSVVDVVGALTDSVNPRDYWFKMKIRVKSEDGLELSTICRQLKMQAPDGKMRATDAANKELKGLKTQNLRDHMSEAELIFTALAELSTRHIAESVKATGMDENKEAGKKGGGIAKKARRELEAKTGRKIVTGENFLPPGSTKAQLEQKKRARK